MGIRKSKKQGVAAKAAPKTTRQKRGASGRSSKDKYAKIRTDLEQQRGALLEEAASMMNPSDLEPFPDLSDQATAESDQSFSIRLKEREQKLLKKIDEALERMAAKAYGICTSCGGEIPYQRLKARPVTTLCIQCKTLQEEQEKIRG